MTLAQLKSKLDEMTPLKVEFVARVVEALLHPPHTQVRERGTWLTGSSDWLEYFSLALSVHHGATSVPLGLTEFETVFRNACRAMNWSTDPPGSATRRFVDLEVRADSQPERKLSLKSTAAKRLSESTVHISKLTEAAWIQDARTPADRRQRTRRLFREYRGAVDSIVMLRAFRRDSIPDRYQLVEIPTSLFASIQDAALDDFRSDAPVIPCYLSGRVVARVALDRSDAKVTVRRIELAACTIHAEWIRSKRSDPAERDSAR